MREELRTKSCPYCGSEEITTGVSSGYASVYTGVWSFSGSTVVHEICTDCGMIVTSYVKKPYIFKKKYQKELG